MNNLKIVIFISLYKALFDFSFLVIKNSFSLIWILHENHFIHIKYKELIYEVRLRNEFKMVDMMKF